MKRLSTTILAAASAGLLFSGTAAAEPPPAQEEQPTAPSPQDQLDVLGSLPIASTLSSYLILGLSSLPLTEFATPVVDGALNSQAANPGKRSAKRGKNAAKPAKRAKRAHKSQNVNLKQVHTAASDEPPESGGSDPISGVLGLGIIEGEGLLAGLPIIGDVQPAADLLDNPAITGGLGGLGGPAAEPKAK